MKLPLIRSLSALLFSTLVSQGAPDPHWLGHDRERPLPPVVNPGAFSSQEQAGTPPSDATVLFDGKGNAQWVALDGSPTKWVVKDGALECVPGSGYVRTLQSFGDCQLHVEWASPTPPQGESQGRGNSGVFFGFNRYEIQVLDSYENKTYADGSAGSIYGQYPPLVNAMRPPGKWQTYDLIWTAPRFDADGKLLSKAYLTLLHNGVLVQNHVEFTGPDPWIGRPPYTAHPERLPIAFQDHGNPVRFRNIWVRELGHHRHPEYMLPEALLQSYVGDYGQKNKSSLKISRLPDGLLSLATPDATVVLHAASPTRFYALTTDVQCEFDFSGPVKKLAWTVGEDFSRAMQLERLSP
ncbi:MAG: DUF1080 domain-containing protein [Opitutae bacterium]